MLFIAFAFLSGLASAAPVNPGDRIAIVGNTYADQLRIHGYLETFLLHHTRDNPVSIRNLGWGGDMLTARDRPTNFPTEESTLTDHKTDVIIACFGMGESFAGKNGLADFKTDLTNFLNAHRGKNYNGESEVRLVLVSPIACEDLGKLTPGREKRNGDLEAYTGAMQEVAAAAKVPFVNLYEPSRYLMDEPGAPKMTTNGIHLNRYGYWAMSRSLAGGLLELGSPWQLRIDARAMTANGQGVQITDVRQDAGGLRFTVKEDNWPSIAPPGTGKVHPQLAGTRDTLVVDGLAPGKYELTVDRQAVVSASHEEWAQGVPVDASPAHREAEAFRATVNDKNLQFTYSWKALNQVHIVGERKKSPSGRALPAEVLAFKKLAEQKDEELRRGIVLKSRKWRLSPTPR